MIDAKTIAVARKLGGGGGGGGSDLARQIVDKTITEFSNNEIEQIGESAFFNCAELQSVKVPNVTAIRKNAFSGCVKLSSCDSPSVTKIENSSFYKCTALESAHFPALKTVESNAFQECTSLVSLVLSAVTMTSSRITSGCNKLEFVDLPIAYSVDANTFYNSIALRTVALRIETRVASLSNVNAFGSTPFASGKSGGILLVPASLVESYKTATNWSTIYGYGTNQFLALEDYTVDGTTTGAIDWDKVNAL